MSSRDFFIRLTIPFIVSFAVFILLNPTTHDNPYENILEIYNYRKQASLDLANSYPDTYLPDVKSRFLQFFSNFYFGDNYNNYNGLKFISTNQKLGILIFILFLSGLFYELRKIKEGDKYSFTILIFFITTLLIMTYYLYLDWPRYYIHVVFFFVYYQTLGLIFCFKTVRNLAKVHIKR